MNKVKVGVLCHSPSIQMAGQVEIGDGSWIETCAILIDGAKVVRHARYVVFQIAEVAVPRTLFQEILDRIRRSKLVAIPLGVG